MHSHFWRYNVKDGNVNRQLSWQTETVDTCWWNASYMWCLQLHTLGSELWLWRV